MMVLYEFLNSKSVGRLLEPEKLQLYKRRIGRKKKKQQKTRQAKDSDDQKAMLSIAVFSVSAGISTVSSELSDTSQQNGIKCFEKGHKSDYFCRNNTSGSSAIVFLILVWRTLFPWLADSIQQKTMESSSFCSLVRLTTCRVFANSDMASG